MKILFQYILLIALYSMAAACKKDNYTAPSLTLSGHIVYNGASIQVERNQVPFQIYQYGFGKVGPIGQTFAQDGSYSSVLFAGQYKIIVQNGQGPFMWKQTAAGNPDTVTVDLSGNKTLDLDVTPYWMIRTPQIAVSGGVVTANFTLEQIITDANAKGIERVSLYLNKNEFVSGGDNNAGTDLDGALIVDPNAVSLSVTIPAMTPMQHYIYARIGLKVSGVEDMIFSPVQKLSF